MDRLLAELKNAYGKDAEFRDGQKEAIEGILNGKRMLVVQKTGWGKSLVYFLATKLLREKRLGITLIISPLLALMHNQVDSANKIGLQVETINSDNQEEWDTIIEQIRKNEVDALIISPERLANAEFKKILRGFASNIMLFVVDEAHCISEWGHDFRPDYRRIVDLINLLPSNVPVLATTATANNRVVNDIKEQLGNDLLISRGSLMREALAIQVVKLGSKEERLAWIVQNMEKLPGTGVIYCLTVNDCKLVNQWLNGNGIVSEAYYADLKKEQKEKVINSFMNNSIKVLVATIAFGMGFDKSDISFVVHFQKPGNIVSYYQQIGRAGRGIDYALAILLCGGEDDYINNYFIDSAFPTEQMMDSVIDAIVRYNGITIRELEKCVKLKSNKIRQCIKYLLVNGDIYEDNKDKKYYKTPYVWKPDLDKSERITSIRKDELLQIEGYTQQKGCYMKYIAQVLDDDKAKTCGKCENCLGRPLLSTEVQKEIVLKAKKFISENYNIIEPRKKWPASERVDGRNVIHKDFLCETGRVLCNYGEQGFGKLVLDGKYNYNYFDDQLVEASYVLLKDFVKREDIKWITNVSSLRRPELVKSFTQRLAMKLGLYYCDVIEKKVNSNCQKELNTDYLQYKNAYESFEIKNAYIENVLLVDDMVDSRWTFTVCGYKLRKSGSGKVFPFALANSAGRNGDE